MPPGGAESGGAADELFQDPVIAMRRRANALNVTPRAARMSLDRLIEARIIEEATGREGNGVHFAGRIIDAIERNAQDG